MIKHPYWHRPLTGAPHSLVSFLLIALLFLLLLLVLPLSLSPQGTIISDHKVLSVVASLVKADPGANDSFIVQFSARIRLQGNGIVKYRWRRSDGGAGPWKEVNFISAGYQSVTTTWTIGAAHSGQEIWESLEINYPNAITSNQAKFQVPPLNFKVTGVLNQVVPNEWTGICPKEFTCTSQITVAGRGVVKYRWVRSNGGTGPQIDLPFDTPGTKSVQSTWKVENHEYDQGVRRWMTVEIISPNHLLPAPDDALATAPRPYAAVFILTCKDYTQNPNVPVQIAVNISGMGVQPSYQCREATNTTPMNMIGGIVTVRNLASNPLICIKDMGGYKQRYLTVIVIHPSKKESLSGPPPWPYVYNNNWYTPELWIPEKIAPHDQFTTSLGSCLNVFDKHVVIYIGAYYQDENGKKTFSNLVKWEKRL